MPAPAPRAPRGRRLLLLLGGLAAGLLLGELGVRLAGLAPEIDVARRGRLRLSANPRLGYEPVPDLDHQGHTGRGFDFKGRSNSLGFRDREHPLPPPPGRLRVLVLGDSIAWGYRVSRSDAVFPARLEAELRRLGLPADVLNFGVTGYNSMQEVAILEDRGLRHQPGIVLLAYCLNDREEASGGILSNLLRQASRSPTGFALREPRILLWSHLYRLLRFHPRLALGGPTVPDDPRSLYADLARDSVEESFQRLSQLAGRHGFRVLVAVFPYLDGISEYRLAAEHQAISRLADRHGFALVDLLEPMQECQRRIGKIWADRWHPNEAGHACAAAALVEPVRALAAGLAAR